MIRKAPEKVIYVTREEFKYYSTFLRTQESTKTGLFVMIPEARYWYDGRGRDALTAREIKLLYGLYEKGLFVMLEGPTSLVKAQANAHPVGAYIELKTFGKEIVVRVVSEEEEQERRKEAEDIKEDLKTNLRPEIGENEP